MRSANALIYFDDPDRLTEAIVGRIGKDIVLALPFGLGKANHVANSVFNRAAGDPSMALRIFTALTLGKPRPKRELERRFLEPISARLFDGYPALAYDEALLQNRLPPNIEVDEFFFLAGSRLNVAASQRNYISANYTHALRYVLDRKVNVVGQLVAKRVRDGKTHYSLSCNPDITLDLLDARRAGRADFILIGQVNSELPYMPGVPSCRRRNLITFLRGRKLSLLFSPRRVNRLIFRNMRRVFMSRAWSSTAARSSSGSAPWETRSRRR
jgi:hypothetical protein